MRIQLHNLHSEKAGCLGSCLGAWHLFQFEWFATYEPGLLHGPCFPAEEEREQGWG